MRKLIAVILFIMLFALTAISEEDAENWYLENAWKQVQVLDEMISSDAYIKMYMSPHIESICTELEDLIPETMPQTYQIVRLDLAEKVLKPVMWLGGIRGEVLEQNLRSIPNALLSSVNSKVSVEWISFTSVIRTSESTIIPDIEFSPFFVIFDLGGDNLPIVVVSEAGERIANFSATFIKREMVSAFTDVGALVDELQ